MWDACHEGKQVWEDLLPGGQLVIYMSATVVVTGLLDTVPYFVDYSWSKVEVGKSKSIPGCKLEPMFIKVLVDRAELLLCSHQDLHVHGSRAATCTSRPSILNQCIQRLHQLLSCSSVWRFLLLLCHLLSGKQNLVENGEKKFYQLHCLFFRKSWWLLK